MLEKDLTSETKVDEFFVGNDIKRSFKQKQQIYIYSNKELYAFYNHLQCRLLNVLLAGRVVTSGLVTRSESKLERSVNLAKEAVGLIPVFGPIARATVSVGSTAINSTHGARESKRLHRLGHFTCNVTHIESITEEVARLITLRYRHQIMQLSTSRRKEGTFSSLVAKADFTDFFEYGGAEELADSAVRRMFEYIADGHIDAQGDLSQQLATAVFNSSGLMPFSKQKIETRSDFETKELIRQKKEKKEKLTEEEEKFKGMNWNDEGIFTRSGIVTPDGRLYRGTNSADQIKKKLNDVSEYMNNSVAWAKSGSEQALKRMATMSGTQLKKIAGVKSEENLAVVVDAPSEDLPKVEDKIEPPKGTPSIASSISGFFSRTVTTLNTTVSTTVNQIADKLTAVGDSEALPLNPTIEAEEKQDEHNNDHVVLEDTAKITSESNAGPTSGANIIILSRCDQIEKYGYRLGTPHEVMQYELVEVPQTEEEREKTRIKYYMDPPVVYDYEKETFTGVSVPKIPIDIVQLNDIVGEMYQQMLDMKTVIAEQKLEIEELKSKLNSK
jgi:hypothetical protein